jgi:hypothetical protein
LQAQFIDLMKQGGFTRLHGKVAVDMIVYTSLKSVPQIQNVVKNILDIMHKEEYLTSNTEEGYLPFEEDKHVKYLRAKYVFIPGDSSIRIELRPFTSFLSDVRFVNSEVGFKERDNDLAENWRKLGDYIDNKDKYLKLLSDDGYEAMKNLAIFDMQKGIADGISITPHMLGLIYPKTMKSIKRTYADWVKMLIEMPIFMKLPGIPVRGEEDDKEHREIKRLYKKALKAMMLKYLKKNPIFGRLLSPVLVSTLYMPPKSKKRDYKDVDNIMREYVMPAMNEVFSPPTSYFDLEPNKCLDGSCIGYEIIELLRSFSDEKAGFLSVGFRMMDGTEISIMKYVDREIDGFIEHHHGNP